MTVGQTPPPELEAGASTLWNPGPVEGWKTAYRSATAVPPRWCAMVFGGVAEERLTLNHERLWRGFARDPTMPGVADRLAEIRARFFSGDPAGSTALAEEVHGGRGRGITSYQPAGKRCRSGRSDRICLVGRFPEGIGFATLRMLLLTTTH